MNVNDINLKDRIAIITGGAQGIGLAIAQRFLKSGAKVVLWDLNQLRLDSARTQLLAESGQGEVFIQTVNIANLDNVEAATKEVVEKFGRKKGFDRGHPYGGLHRNHR